MEVAAEETERADVFVIIGTSLNVYPAASLIQYTRPGIPIYLIDPKPVRVPGMRHVEVIEDVASRGMRVLKEKLMTMTD